VQSGIVYDTMALLDLIAQSVMTILFGADQDLTATLSLPNSRLL
jgi:hypothetical protein